MLLCIGHHRYGLYGNLGFFAVGNTNKGIAVATCAAAMIFDDVLNGNLTNDRERYTMGTTNLHDKLNTITPDVNALANDLQTNTQADMAALKVKTTTAKG